MLNNNVLPALPSVKASPLLPLLLAFKYYSFSTEDNFRGGTKCKIKKIYNSPKRVRVQVTQSTAEPLIL